MSTPTERPAPLHSAALDALIGGQPVPDLPPPEPEPAAAQPPPAPVVEPALPVVSHLAAVPTTSPEPAAVFQPAPGDRRAQLRHRAAHRSRQRRGVSA